MGLGAQLLLTFRAKAWAGKNTGRWPAKVGLSRAPGGARVCRLTLGRHGPDARSGSGQLADLSPQDLGVLSGWAAPS